MKVFVRVKAIAKRRPVIDSIPIEIPDNIKNSNDLITFIVRKNVKDYNEKPTTQHLLKYLTADEIEDQKITGKVGFGDQKSENQQNEEQAVKNALQCYEDGIFRMMIGADEVGYNQAIKLAENMELTFIRLTMLAGRLW